MVSVVATRRQSCRALVQGEIDLAGASSLRLLDLRLRHFAIHCGATAAATSRLRFEGLVEVGTCSQHEQCNYENVYNLHNFNVP